MIIRDFFDPGKPIGLVDCAVYAGLGIAQVVVSSEGSQLINALTPIVCTLVFSKIICQLSEAISPNSLTSSGKRVYSLLLAGCAVFKTVELFGSISLSSLMIIATLAALPSRISVNPSDDESEKLKKKIEELSQKIEELERKLGEKLELKKQLDTLERKSDDGSEKLEKKIGELSQKMKELEQKLDEKLERKMQLDTLQQKLEKDQLESKYNLERMKWAKEQFELLKTIEVYGEELRNLREKVDRPPLSLHNEEIV